MALHPLHDRSPVTPQTSSSPTLPLAHSTPATLALRFPAPPAGCSFPGYIHGLLGLKYCLSKGPSLTRLVKIATHPQLSAHFLYFIILPSLSPSNRLYVSFIYFVNYTRYSLENKGIS